MTELWTFLKRLFQQEEKEQEQWEEHQDELRYEISS